MKQKKLTEKEKSILRFWLEFLPLQLFRSRMSPLPKAASLPSPIASERELLAFYSQITPRPINQLIDLVGKLQYPIFDIQDLRGQLADVADPRSEGAADLANTVRVVEPPYISIDHALRYAVALKIMQGLAECHKQYKDCMKKADSAETMAKCERQYNECQDLWGPFALAAALAILGGVWPKPPIPLPIPPPLWE
jgi:hypothetical protein